MQRQSVGYGRRWISFTIGFVATAVLGCGGNVNGVGGHAGNGGPGTGQDDGGAVNPACPAPFDIGSGDACATSGLTCPSGIAVDDCAGQAHSLECFCERASWTCEIPAVPDCSAPPAECPSPSVISPGAACESVGEPCPSTLVPSVGCDAAAAASEATCTCTPSGWQCPEDALPCAPQAPPASTLACPPPPAVEPGAPCPVGFGQVCSAILKTSACGNTVAPPVVPCTCTPGGWECPALPSCAMPAPISCPDPSTVYAGNPCAGEGLSCQGNPQICDGQTFYDAFECAGSWVAIATTVCTAVGDAGAAEDAVAFGDSAVAI